MYVYHQKNYEKSIRNRLRNKSLEIGIIPKGLKIIKKCHHSIP